MTTTPQILPCPYCPTGGDMWSDESINASGNKQHYACCHNDNCWAMGPGRPTESEAISAWNRIAADRTAVKLPKEKKRTVFHEDHDEGSHDNVLADKYMVDYYNQALSEIKKLNPNLKFEE